jgi:hypothetical protein
MLLLMKSCLLQSSTCKSLRIHHAAPRLLPRCSRRNRKHTSDSYPRVTCGRDRPMLPSARRQSLFSHQTRHPLAGAGDALIPHFSMNPGDCHTPVDRSGRFLEYALRAAGLPADGYSSDVSSRHSSRSVTPQVSHTGHFRDTPCDSLPRPGTSQLAVREDTDGFFRISRSCRVHSSSRLRRR